MYPQSFMESILIPAFVLQVPGMIISEHVLFVHNPRPSGSPLAVLGMYILLGTRLEEARADIVFGSRMVHSAQSGHCPYRGGINCLPHMLIASTIIVASAIDYITESIEVRSQLCRCDPFANPAQSRHIFFGPGSQRCQCP